ncbi:MAG: hypothetical protein RJB38_1925 [Pseudomonadota bacterium]
MKKLTLVMLAVMALFNVANPSAWAHPSCRQECWYDRWGGSHCTTRCDHHHHHPAPPSNDDAAGALLLSASSLALFATTIADNPKEVVAIHAAEDAAAYFETGKLTGTLAALVRVARDEFMKTAGAEKAAALTEAELVDGILAAAEAALN